MVKVKQEPKKLIKRKGATKNESKIKTKNKRIGRSQGGKRKISLKKERDPAGVVYLSHIPHGFYDDQIEGYFSQFGKVTAVSVPRSKTGRVKGFAFIEYKHPEIAKIAAETMDNYLMFNRLLKAKYIPPEAQKPRLFAKAKEAREKHTTAADRTALAVKHNRKVKNRHLKITLEAKYATKLLKKRNALLKRGEKFGLNNAVAIGEMDLQSIIDKRNEMARLKKIESDKENPQEKGVDITEDKSSSDDSVSEDSEDVDITLESDEEDIKKLIAKAKKTSKDIIQKGKKSSPKVIRLQRHNVGKKEIIEEDKSVLQEKNILSPKVVAKKKKENTPLNIPKLTKPDAIVENKKETPRKTKERKKSFKKDDDTCFIKGAKPSAKNKTRRSQTPRDEGSDPQKILEVDVDDREIDFRTPPGYVKKYIKVQDILSPKTQKSPEKSMKEGRKSTRDRPSSSEKKPRHRKLKRLAAQ